MSGKIDSHHSSDHSSDPSSISFVAALRTLYSWVTIIPAQGVTHYDRGVGKAVMNIFPLAAFPFSLLALAGFFLAPYTSSFLLAALITAGWVFLSRGMHIDGLGDMSDALGSWAPPEKAHKILSEPTTGSFAIASIVLNLLIQCAAIEYLLRIHSFYAFIALILCPFLARWSAMIITMRGAQAFSPTGFGSLIIGTVAPYTVALWAALLFCIFGIGVPMVGASISYNFAGIMLLTLVALLLSSLYIRKHCTKRFLGLNGDIVGAAVEIGTTLSLSCFALLINCT